MWRRWNLVAILLISILSVGIYGRTLSFDLLGWDDNFNIFLNPWIQSDNLWHLLITPYRGLFVPVASTVWFILSKIAGSCSWVSKGCVFHLVNLCLHIINSIIVYALIRLVFELSHLSKKSLSSNQRVPVACLVGALIFCSHPLQVDAVAWASGLRDLLSTFFGLICIFSYLKNRDRKGRVMACIFFTLAIFSKPSALLLPFVLILLERYIWPTSKLKAQALRLLPCFVLSFVLVVVTQDAQNHGMMPVVPWVMRPLVMVDSLLFYIGKILLPWHLRLDYQSSIQAVLAYFGNADNCIIFSLYLLLICSSLIVIVKSSSLVGRFAVIVFLGLWLPISGIIPFEFQSTSTVSNHYMYFPLFGASTGLARLSLINLRASVLKISVILSIFIVFWTSLSVDRVGIWKNDRTFYNQIFLENPANAQALNGLGVFAITDGRLEQAHLLLKKVHQLYPTMAIPFANYAEVLFRLGLDDEMLTEVAPDLVQATSGPVSEDVQSSLQLVVSAVTETQIRQGKLNDARQTLCRFRNKISAPFIAFPALWQELKEKWSVTQGSLQDCSAY